MGLKIAKIFLALAAVCATALGSTTYTQSITSSTSSLTITHAQHGFSSTGLSVNVIDGTNNLLPTTAFSYSINSSTYDVSMTFSPAISSGTVQIIGAFTANTSASTDFLVSRIAEGQPTVYKIAVCWYCTSSVQAIRTTGGKSYVLGYPVKFTYNSGNLSHYYVYIQDNVVVMGVNAGGVSISCSGSSVNGACRVDLGVYSFPAGTVHLADGTFTNGAFDGPTDDRPAAFQ
jgi:hypothetical protein